MPQLPRTAGAPPLHSRTMRHVGAFTPHDHRAYRCDLAMTDGAVCPECHASIHAGRWQWLAAAADAVESRCPACQRIDDDFPARFLTIEGNYFDTHRVELMNLVQTRSRAIDHGTAVPPARVGS